MTLNLHFFQLFDSNSPPLLKMSQPLTREDLILSPRITECCSASPTDHLIAFTMKKFSDDGKKSSINLFIHDAQEHRTTQLTRNESGAVSNPVFVRNVPGVEDALLYTKGPDSQVFAVPLCGGESSKVTSFPLPVESFKLVRSAGDKLSLLLSMSVYPGMSPEQTASKDAEIAAAAPTETSAMEFDKLMVRHWDTWDCYSKRNHLFLCPLTVKVDGTFPITLLGPMVPYPGFPPSTFSSSLFGSSSDLVDLMLQWESDCPSKPFGGAEEYSASPDGTRVAMACRRVEAEKDGSNLKTQPRDFAWTTCVSLFLSNCAIYFIRWCRCRCRCRCW